MKECNRRAKVADSVPSVYNKSVVRKVCAMRNEELHTPQGLMIGHSTCLPI